MSHTQMKQSNTQSKEMIWQQFFEKNTWIFGYGLNYIFNSTLDLYDFDCQLFELKSSL